MNGDTGHQDQESSKWRRRAALLLLLFLVVLLFIVLLSSSLSARDKRMLDQRIRAAREWVRSDGQVLRAFGNPVQVGERPKAVSDDGFTFDVTGPSASGEADIRDRRSQNGRRAQVTGVRVNKEGGSRTASKSGSGNDGKTPDATGDGSDSGIGDGDGTTDAGEVFDNATIRFAGGKYSKVIKAVEAVVGKGHVRASTRRMPGGTAWTCVTVDGPERVCLMDPAWTLDDFPVLKEAGFQPVRGPSAKTLSIYSSVTISTMSYDREQGDRVVVLVCPKADWETLKVPWPE